MQYNSYQFSNGLRLIYLPSDSPVAYCGFSINAGTRDELSTQLGLAHFVEHMLFKGTEKRKSWHIINRMEHVGGEINAYTTKEETMLYSVCLSEDTERAMELLSDLLFHSRFPESEIEKEKEVVIDEINSYRDTPSELIFDEFENQVFQDSELGRSILGDEESVNSFSSQSCVDFLSQHYYPGNMVFFYYGKVPYKKIIRLANKYFAETPDTETPVNQRQIPHPIPAGHRTEDMDLHQSHAIIGCRAYSIYDKNRMGLYLINNILGGPGMNSRLNLSLREKHGLVYTVESNITSYSDTGIISIYFGCDHNSQSKCHQLVIKELKKLRENKLSTSQLATAIKQLKGQLGVGTDHRESKALAMGKSFLRHNHYASLEEVYGKIEALSAHQLWDIANEVFDEDKLFSLVFK